ncbi:NAD(P)/FAD-dependent oxidoreductase [Shimia sp. Alg240-R146]|uniref:NAD(P)/FAD-dependent oxidoreductase n=1 Tax=Shimia sp. Alg240-R146 TaxID=2993449 RepID=UPI0022E546D2|nr:FAD-dependent oxidoreductase [Shimia sp. Alg240-R146]
MDADFAIVGGGIVGLSVALGLLDAGQGVVVLDGSDADPKASRGNFGLIWLQGKGVHQPRYARWSKESADLWPGFAARLKETSGVDVGLRQDGGLDLHFNDDSLADAVTEHEALQAELGAEYPFEVLTPETLSIEEPEVGPKVAAAILHHGDGHVDPLALIKALSAAVVARGGRIIGATAVTDVAARGAADAGFRLTCADGAEIQAAKVVLAAGLGSAQLGPGLGFAAPLRPERGQILITEKLPPLIRRPSLIARQDRAGGIQIGATNEDVGMDRRVTLDGMAKLAAEAVDAYPVLARAQVLRAWGALRVMSPDGLPIYQESPTCPGAFLISCHSGVTLAAVHAMSLPSWLLRRDSAPDLEVFGETRFAA